MTDETDRATSNGPRVIAMRKWNSAQVFVIATAVLCGLAWVQTQIAHVAGRPRLGYLIFSRLFAFTDQWGAGVELVVVLGVLAAPALRLAGVKVAVAMGERPQITATLSFVALGLGAKFAYRATPLSMDEYSQLAQAYAFAHGHLSWHVPVALLDHMIPTGFRNYFLAVNAQSGEVASLYWPGFAALLSPFALIGVPWLLNPALAALTLILMHAIATKLCASREAGGWAILFTLASPVFTINSISFYSMPAHLALNLLFAWWLLDGRTSRAFLAGMVGSVALLLHNPVPHVLFAAPWLIWLFREPKRWRALGAAVVGYLPLSIFVGFGWVMVTESISSIYAISASGAQGGWGLLIAKFSGVLSLPDDALVFARINATWKIWIWSAPGLLILMMYALKRTRGELLLFAYSAGVTYLIYWVVPFDQGHGWGYRYFYTAWAGLPLLAAAYLAGNRPNDERTLIRAWAGGFALTGLILVNGFWFWQVHQVISEHTGQRIPVPDSGRWAVFVTWQSGLYTWDMIQNFPYDTHRLLFISYGRDADAAFMKEHFPAAVRTVIDSRGSEWRLSTP